MRSIVLIGFMGTGKSTVGKQLAQELDWDFIDTDLEIAKTTNMSVSEIFQRYGERRFRSEERLVVQKASRQERTVIAVGGGTVVDPRNWADLAENGTIVWLQASLEEIISRVGHKNDRPLLKGSSEEVEKLWSERQKFYARADLTVDTTQKELDEIVSEILEGLRRLTRNECT